MLSSIHKPSREQHTQHTRKPAHRRKKVFRPSNRSNTTMQRRTAGLGTTSQNADVSVWHLAHKVASRAESYNDPSILKNKNWPGRHTQPQPQPRTAESRANHTTKSLRSRKVDRLAAMQRLFETLIEETPTPNMSPPLPRPSSEGRGKKYVPSPADQHKQARTK